MIEYAHVGFNTSDGAFASAFFGLTGLHGAHVFVGLTLLDDRRRARVPRPLLAGAPPRGRDPRDLLALRRRHVDRRVRHRLPPLTARRWSANPLRRSRRPRSTGCSAPSSCCGRDRRCLLDRTWLGVGRDPRARGARRVAAARARAAPPAAAAPDAGARKGRGHARPVASASRGPASGPARAYEPATDET